MTQIQNKRIKVLMTGGHITPAMATIEELRREYPSWEIVFVGRKKALEGHATLSEEYRIISDLGIPFLPISAGRLKREGGMAAVLAILKIPLGFFQSVWYISQERPSVIVSFGGYVALPVVGCAWIWRIPVVTHEQTTMPGLANRIISKFATKICVSFEETIGSFSRTSDTVLTGLPVRQSVLHPPKTGSLSLASGRPLISIVGGSTGSTSINNVVFEVIRILIKEYSVVHQVGRISLEKALSIKRAIPKVLQDRYMPVAYLSTDEYSYLLSKSALVIGRAGANTVTELGLRQKVAILIPLPWAGNNEQYHNAQVLRDAGSAIIVEQKNLTHASLLHAIKTIMDALPEYSRRAKELAPRLPSDGARRLVAVVSQVLHI